MKITVDAVFDAVKNVAQEYPDQKKCLDDGKPMSTCLMATALKTLPISKKVRKLIEVDNQMFLAIEYSTGEENYGPFTNLVMDNDRGKYTWGEIAARIPTYQKMEVKS